jgi:hypothetical protein
VHRAKVPRCREFTALSADPGDCIDWLTGGTNSAFRSEVDFTFEAEIGNKDDAFGKGTDENDETPTIVAGSIPPNKSDLKSFGLMTENGPGTTRRSRCRTPAPTAGR